VKAPAADDRERTGGIGTPVLAISELSKTFGGAKALDAVSLQVKPGEIHGLLGQNGSGKSTLIKILAGFYEPDPGARLEIAGRPVVLPIMPGGFVQLGISFVHQHLGLVPSLTVLENLLIGDIAAENRWAINRQAEARRARELFRRYRLYLDPTQSVTRLSAVERALLAIVRAFDQLRRRGAVAGHGGLLILDEPTPFLPAHEVGKLFKLIRELVQEGATVVFVSHDIDEVIELTNRGTVLRDGRIAGSFETGSVSKEDIVKMIVGRHVAIGARSTVPANYNAPELHIDHLSGRTVSDLSLQLHRGEIVGLTGLIGSGYDEVVALLYGAIPATAGTLTINGTTYELTTITPAKAIRIGCIFVPADRLNDGAFTTLSILENISLPILGSTTHRWAIRRGKLVRNSRNLLQRFEVRPPEPLLAFGFLSGGNQQKVVLAKWLQLTPLLILLDEPTQGVDVGAREEVYAAVRQMTKAGACVLCASADFEQLNALADRVIVFSRGRPVTELAADQISKAAILEACYSSYESRAEGPEQLTEITARQVPQ
jgi:ribose transport system ATP-binding protein